MMTSNSQNEFISVISRNIKPGHEKDYDDWLQRYLTLERKAPGYLGATIIIPGGPSSTLRYIIIRFTDKPSMKAWEDSPESLKLLDEVNSYSTRHYDTAAGLETWFTLPQLKNVVAQSPPRWKMAIVVFIAVYAISSLTRSILNPFIGQWPILSNTVIYTAILVVSLTYFAMPIMSRLLRRWLYPRKYQQDYRQD